MSSARRSKKRARGGLRLGPIILAAVVAVGIWVFLEEYSGPRPEELSNTGAGPAVLAKWPPPGDNVELARDMTIVNYYVILDGSGSMSAAACRGEGSKIEQSRLALKRFAQLVPKSANLGLLAFDADGVQERLPLGQENRERFVAQVRDVRPSGSTPLRRAIQLGRERLEDQARRQLGYGEYHLVVVTDGHASSGEDPRQVVNELLTHSPIVLHTIGFCIGADHTLNQPGRILYRAANDLEELQSGLSAVLAESPNFDVQRFQ